jgi:hypothetical protein
MMKHGKLKYEANSYTLETNPYSGALLKGGKLNLINIPSFYFQLRGTSMPSRPSTTMMLGIGAQAARVS